MRCFAAPPTGSIVSKAPLGCAPRGRSPIRLAKRTPANRYTLAKAMHAYSQWITLGAPPPLRYKPFRLFRSVAPRLGMIPRRFQEKRPALPDRVDSRLGRRYASASARPSSDRIRNRRRKATPAFPQEGSEHEFALYSYRHSRFDPCQNSPRQNRNRLPRDGRKTFSKSEIGAHDGSDIESGDASIEPFA